MRIIFLGSGEFAVPVLRRLAHDRHDIPLVVTPPARRAGRGRRLTPTPVAEVAEELGLHKIETPEVNDPQIVQRFQLLEARLGLAVDFGQRLGAGLLASMPGGCINLHASLLPKYRGAAPINWAIIRGEERTGCTVFRMVERMDAGPILSSRWTDIKPEETAGELHDRLAGVGVDAVAGALEFFEGGAFPEGTPQNEAEATRAPKLRKADGVIRFDQPARTVVNHIRGMTPWPGARTRYESAEGRWEEILIARARRAEDPASPTVEPGRIDARLHVAVGDAFVELLEVKPSSGRLMTWPEYVNGRHVAPGDMFVAPER